MKGSFFWNHISKVYGHLTKDDDIADEVLAHYSGKLGTDLLRDWQKEIEANPENIRDNTQALKAIGRLKAVLDRFWKELLTGWESILQLLLTWQKKFLRI